MNARLNTHLIVLPKVVLTHQIEVVIVKLDEEFRKRDQVGFVTSGLRTELNQLQIIQDYLVRTGWAKKYPVAMNCKVQDTMLWEGRTIFKWQLGWSKLLEIGVIINPPKRAMVLKDYIRNGVNKKGQFINPSPHFRGGAFDIGGGDNGVQDEIDVVNPMVGVIPELIGTVIERKNNCLHCDTKFISPKPQPEEQNPSPNMLDRRFC